MKKETLKRLLQFAKPYLWYWVFALIAAVISVTMTLLAPVIIGDAIDFIIGEGTVFFDEIIKLVVILGAVVLVGAFFQWIMSRCTNQITQRTVRDIRIAAFSKLESLPFKVIDGSSHGDIISRIVNDIDQIADGLLHGFTQLFSGIVTIVGTLIFMLNINLTITLVVVIITPLSLFVASFIAKRSYDMFRRQSALRGEIGGYIEEYIGGHDVVKAFQHEKKAQTEFEEINKRLYDCGVRAQFYSSITNPCTRFVNGVVYAAVGLVGAISAINGSLTVGQLSCFLAYANQYTKPFNEISGVITELQSAIASASRVFALIDEKPEPKETAKTLAECDGNVRLQGVSFSYSKQKKLIENLNLFAASGQRIAIVGPTGCGKTTLINLLMRFYDVNSGKITVDDTDIRDVTRSSLRRNYGMVLQDTWLFSGTVFENIAYGMPNATREQVVEAAKAAHAHSFIKRLPNGYDTMLSEDGANISGGQKQLLCIARVMLIKPPMLILDEATSSIDTLTEIRVQKAFSAMMQGRTSFIVAHRLSTIKEADCILVMKDGNIIEQGTHKQLLSQNGFYAELYNSQFKRI